MSEPCSCCIINPHGLSRRKIILSCAGLATLSTLLPFEAKADLVPYGNSVGGPYLDINGSKLPKDIVFRVLPVLMPIKTFGINSLYGLRRDPINGYSSMHTGVDFQGVIGTPVYSTALGRVTFVGRNGGYGNMVDVVHGLGFSTRYAHLSAFSVEPGQTVDRYQQVGLVGDTGRITGPHLHFEIRQNDAPLDPIAFLIKANDLYKHIV